MPRDDAEDLVAYQRGVDTFLSANAPGLASQSGTTHGSDRVSVFEEIDPERERAQLAEAKRWRAIRWDGGFGWITGPARYGGAGLTSEHERIYAHAEARYDLPDQGFFGIGLGMVAPTILAHASDQAKERYLAPMHRGDIVGCQLFSEPGAGSDLAGLQTRAERDGDHWVLTGQKVWTSGAHYAQIGEVICRTDPGAPKHRGLTAFIVNMDAPGVEVRPLRQMTGGSSFNEVFFDQVRVPDDHRLGEIGGGWTVALTTLLNERASIGTGGVASGGITEIGEIGRLIDLLRRVDAADDPVRRQELMRLHSGFRVAEWNNKRAMDAIASGGIPGPELSGAKLSLTTNLRALAAFVTGVLGPRIAADSGEWGTYAWADFVLGVPGLRLAGGTDEIQRNIIGEKVLGLPKDPPPQSPAR